MCHCRKINWEIKYDQVIIGNKIVQMHCIKGSRCFSQTPNDDVFLIEGAADILRDVC